MRSWQSILVNGCVTIIAVIVAIGIFIPDTPSDNTKNIQESLNTQVKGIQLKLSAIEEAVLRQRESISVTPKPSESAISPESLSKLNQKLDMILGKLSVLENKSMAAQAPQAFERSFGPPPMVPRQLPPSFSAKGQNPTSWIDSLSDEKKREVEIIFEERTERMREKLPPPGPDGNLPDRKTIRRVMKETDLQLKESLKTILTEEEYQQFLDSHPNPRTQPPALPGIRGNQ